MPMCGRSLGDVLPLPYCHEGWCVLVKWKLRLPSQSGREAWTLSNCRWVSAGCLYREGGRGTRTSPCGLRLMTCSASCISWAA